MARALLAIGRMSPCAITRFMCSSGSARTQTVKHEASSNSSVPGSVTMLPLVAITKSMLAQHVVECFALGAAEGLLTEHVEDFAQGGAAALLDLAVELDEGHVRGAPPACGRASTCRRRAGRSARCAGDLGGRGEMLDELARFGQAAGGSRSRNCDRSTRSSGGSAPSCTSWVTGRPMARAIRRSSTIEQLPRPASSWAR